jgi:hypothetical protein
MNKSRILTLSAAVVGILLLVIGGAWFWSAGSVAAEKLPSIRVQTVKGTVEYKTGDVWTQVLDVQEVHAGDTVRTGPDSEAEILWGDQGVTRLDQVTELVIDDAPVDGAGSASSVIRLKLNAGRVWNRMLKLLDVDSSMEVRTSDVVATVRGTSYGIIKQPSCTEAAVTESAVGVLSTGTSDEVLLTDNQWGSFGANDCKRPVRRLTKDDAWPAEQHEKDLKFDRDFMRDLRDRLDLREKTVSSAPDWIRNASQNLHLSLAGDKESLALAYAKQELARAIANPTNSKDALVRIRALLPQIGNKAGVLRGELHAVTSFLARSRYPGLREDLGRLALPSSLADDEVLDEWRLVRDLVIGSADADQRYRELVRIDERVDDILEDAIPSDQRTQIVADVMSRLDAADAVIGADGDERLKSKSKAIRARLAEALGIPLELVPVEPNPADKPEININEPTLRAPVIKPAPGATTTPTSRPYLTLNLLASPSSPVGNQIVTLKLFGTKADGMAEDISAKATFSLSRPSDGFLQGTILNPVFIGNIVIIASYTDVQGTRTVQTTINHLPATQVQTNGLQSIEIRFTGPTSVTCSTSVPYKVFAMYGDKTSKDVTISAKMSVSDSKLLYPGDQKILTFCSGQQASGTVTASYTESGVTKTSSGTITVTPDASTPSSPRYPYRIY